MLKTAAAISSRISIHVFALKNPHAGMAAACSARSVGHIQRTAGSILGLCLAVSLNTFAQTPALNAQTPTPGTPQVSQVGRVTTTVVVHGEVKDDYLPEAVTVGTLDGAPLKETPLSAVVLTRGLLSDQGAHLLSDVVKNDASVGEDYAPVGYYGDYQIRGFVLDQDTGFQINGLTVVGEQNVPLENKESVEILKGIAGVESGITAAGGLIDYVTKRPAIIETLDLATDHRGSSYGAVDLGRFFGRQKQVGARLNLGGERTQSYVHGADGWNAMGAGAADWKISSKATLKGDFEYQHAIGRSVAGYQLLGGTTVPDLSSISPATMLGEQSWEKPNTFDTTNSNARLDYDLGKGWNAFAAASFSHSLRDDNVVYAYGCGYQSLCQGSGGTSPDYFFAPDGGYDIYDWRQPGVVMINAQAEALATGHVKTGPFSHDLTAGGEVFRRSAQEPGFYTMATPVDLNGVIQNGPVYSYVGSDNIYQPIAPVDLASVEDPHQSAGPRRLYIDNHQASLIVQDRIHLPGRFQLLVGGREDAMHNHNYSPYTTCNDFTIPGACQPDIKDRSIWLPQYAVTFQPVSGLMLYGNYSVLLSLAPQASWFTDNGNQYLNPFFTRQAELGAKYELDRRILLTAALFHMRAPFFYPKVIAGPDGFCPSGQAGDLCFESEGRETHNGIEFNAEGKATNWLRLTASGAGTNAISDQTGTPSFDNQQVINVPHLRTAVFADLSLPHAHGLHLMPGWGYTGRKDATRDDVVSVSGYNLFNLGARFTPGGERGHVTLRLYADNITGKRYWKDTGGNGGDTFLHLGAPTTVRLMAHYTF